MRAKRTRASSDVSGASPQQPVKKLVKATSVTSETTKAKAKPSSSGNYPEDNDVESDPAKDVMTFQKTCQSIQTLFERIKSLKDQGIDPSNPEIDNLRIQGLLSFVVLKKCNRAAHLRNRKSKDKTQEAKQEVDSLHLQLQNLLYEIMHLKKEINKCLQFKSKDEEIDLVSKEEILKEKGRNIDVTDSGPHQLMLARLDWELQERVRLVTKKQDYVETKQKVAQEIQTKNEFLNSLEPRLNSVLQATLPIQDYMGVPLDAQRSQYKTAKFLPRPLYVLLVQSTAYQEACDPELKVSIIGDVEAAKAVIEAKPGVVDVGYGEKNDEDEPEEVPKKRHHRRATDEVLQEERCKAALKKHPLQVQLEIVCENEANVILLFSYMPVLNIVTVTVQVNLIKEASAPVFSGRSLLCPDSVLTCLFPDDFGNTTPNPANYYQLSNLGMKDFSSHIPKNEHPYIWVQKICGLEFPSLDSKTPEVPTVEPSVSASHMESTVKAIKSRILTRVSLQSQLHSLELLNVEVGNKGRELFPVKALSKLESWTPLTISDFMELPFVDRCRELENITENDLLFVATFTRDKVKLHAAVIVLSDYPNRPPLFTCAVSRSGSYVRDDYVRALETEVNVFYEELFAADCKDKVLSNQLRRLQMCFDIYNDTNTSNQQDRPNHEFLILRTKRGRDRALALKYDDNHGCFTHRC